MDSLHVRNLMEAYVSVYDEDLRQELSYIDEDLSFVDDLSDNELVQIMEEILSEEEVTLQECLDIFEGELLSEARVDMAARAKARREYAASSEKSASEARKRSASAQAAAEREKTAERGRVAKKHAMKRLQVAATKAGRNIQDKAQKAKTLGAGAASAVAGGAAEAGRAIKGKLASAKEKIKGFLKGAKKAAIKVADRISGKEAKRTAIKRTAFNKRKEERAAAAKTSARNAFNKPSSANSGGPSSTGRLLPPAGGTTKSKPNVGRTRIGNQTKPVPTRPGVRIAGGSGFGNPERGVSTPQTTKKGMKTAAGAITKINASYEMLTDMIAEELMFEGYASNLWEAYDIIVEMNDFDLDDIVEAFEEHLVEEVEGEEYVDAYDVVLQHLLDEGYADSVESAESIMANMSEEWRSSILG